MLTAIIHTIDKGHNGEVFNLISLCLINWVHFLK